VKIENVYPQDWASLFRMGKGLLSCVDAGFSFLIFSQLRSKVVGIQHANGGAEDYITPQDY
jgi:hypothetical protein